MSQHRRARRLPEAFVIVDENDVLRDEGEACARKLIEAGVRTTSVRYTGIILHWNALQEVMGCPGPGVAAVLVPGRRR